MQLLDDIHFLAAVVSPLTKQNEFGALLSCARTAFNRFLVNSPAIFHESALNEKSSGSSTIVHK